MKNYTSNMNAIMNGHLGLPGDEDNGKGKNASAVLTLPTDTLKPINIKDVRKINGATGSKMSDSFSKSGAYDANVIRNVIKAAKHNGVDPNLALAVALQETGMGSKTTLDNVVHWVYGEAPKGLDQGAWELTKALKEKMTEGKKLGFNDEAHAIQMFNGMGKLKAQDGKPKTMYGIKITPDQPLDMKKNPVYGRTIIDIRDNVIKNHPEIQSLISNS